MNATNEDLAGDGASDDQVALAGDWALWRDFAVRAAGFPVTGLDVFGAGDEGERLREVASDPLFREAVAWQNRQALVTQIEAIAHAVPQSELRLVAVDLSRRGAGRVTVPSPATDHSAHAR
jgi:hypothetical protein